MKHITTQIDEEFVIFEKYSVTPNELFFLKMLLLAKEEDMQDTIYRYFKLPEAARGSIIEMLKTLKEKGIILSTYKVPLTDRLYQTVLSYTRSYRFQPSI